MDCGSSSVACEVYRSLGSAKRTILTPSRTFRGTEVLALGKQTASKLQTSYSTADCVASPSYRIAFPRQVCQASRNLLQQYRHTHSHPARQISANRTHQSAELLITSCRPKPRIANGVMSSGTQTLLLRDSSHGYYLPASIPNLRYSRATNCLTSTAHATTPPLIKPRDLPRRRIDCVRGTRGRFDHHLCEHASCVEIGKRGPDSSSFQSSQCALQCGLTYR